MKQQKATYKPAKVHNRRGDIKKEWFVEFQYWDEKADRFKRFRDTGGVNKLNNPRLRIEVLDEIALEINEKLAKGWNPITNDYEDLVIYSKDSWETCVPIILGDKIQSTSLGHAQYKYILANFTTYLTRRGLNTVHPKNIEKSVIMDYLSWRLNTSKIKKGTRDRDLVIIKCAFKVLMLRGIIKHNPCDGIPRLGDRPERNETYSPDQLKDLINYLEKNNTKMLCFCVLVMAAIRPSEIRRLQIKDLDLNVGTVRIKNTKSKNAYPRVARIPSVLLRFLNHLKIDGVNPDYYIFHPSGIPQPTMHSNKYYWSKEFSAIKEKLGFGSNITMYSLKHTVLTEMYNTGASTEELMAYGGFKTLDALQSYLKKQVIPVPADPSHRLGRLL
ncbi:MAG: tyrosine-type recombinase/integrase [Bacteroidetes bacterium]|nr:tyrosine-type recombinase/integrase [Bacteroidota bacterium]